MSDMPTAILKFLRPILLSAALIGACQTVHACPNCKEAIANQDGSDAEGLRKGYFWSIIMMISVPFSLVGAGTFVVIRAVKRGSLPPL
jgi:hypothetical protein